MCQRRNVWRIRRCRIAGCAWTIPNLTNTVGMAVCSMTAARASRKLACVVEERAPAKLELDAHQQPCDRSTTNFRVIMLNEIKPWEQHLVSEPPSCLEPTQLTTGRNGSVLGQAKRFFDRGITSHEYHQRFNSFLEVCTNGVFCLAWMLIARKHTTLFSWIVIWRSLSPSKLKIWYRLVCECAIES